KPLTQSGDSWQLLNFDIASFLDDSYGIAWYNELFGFENDDSSWNYHYDYPQYYSRDRFDFYFTITDEYGNTIITQTYSARYDNFTAKGTFGQVQPDSSGFTKDVFWELGAPNNIGNIIFGTSNQEHRKIYLTPGYIYNSTEKSYYIDGGFMFLHNIEKIELYNGSDSFLGEMSLNPTTVPLSTYEFVLSAKDFDEGMSYVKAKIIDKAGNEYITIQDIYVYKDLDYSVSNATLFGDIIYYDKDINYTQNPHTFYGTLDNWITNANKSDVSVEISYYDYQDQLWLPLSTSTTTDGTFTVDWEISNETLFRLMKYQSGYVPINFTYDDHPGTYFYGSYGQFDSSGTISPFLVAMDGEVFIYAYNESSHEWYINFTDNLGISLYDMEIKALDISNDSLVDLVLFNRFSDADNITFYIFDDATDSFVYNQSILADTGISYQFAPDEPKFREIEFDFTGTSMVSMYVAISNSSLDVNFIAKLDFDSYLTKSQDNDATQTSIDRPATSLHITSEKVYIGTVWDINSTRPDSAIYTIDKSLDNSTYDIFDADMEGIVIQLESINSELGEVIVTGISMDNYSMDDKVIYYVYDSAVAEWYKTSFSPDSDSNDFASETFDYRIREIVYSDEGTYDKAVISSSKGIYKTKVVTKLLEKAGTAIFYAVDSFREWDLNNYNDTTGWAILPFSSYPALEIISVNKYTKQYSSGAYVYDKIEEITSIGYQISPDKKGLACDWDYFGWGPRSENQDDIYYEVKYFYTSTLAEASGLVSGHYSTSEFTHNGSISASSSDIDSNKLGFQLRNKFDIGNEWTFDYGTSFSDWNYQNIPITTGVPYTLKSGAFIDSGITSAGALSGLTEFDNKRMNYYDIGFGNGPDSNWVTASANLSQFATGQDFFSPNDYQNTYENSYMDVWVEDLSLSSSVDFMTDLPDYTQLGASMDDILDDPSSLYDDLYSQLSLADTVAYRAQIVDAITYSGDGTENLDVQSLESKDRSDVTRVYDTTGHDVIIDIPFRLDHNDDSSSIKTILLSVGFGQYSASFRDITFSVLDRDGTSINFEDASGVNKFQALTNGGSYKQTINFGESIKSQIISDKYYRVSNAPSDADFLIDVFGPTNINGGYFKEIGENKFQFIYGSYQNHIYDYNYLRIPTNLLDVSSDNYFTDGNTFTVRAHLKSVPSGITNHLAINHMSAIVLTDKNNLNNLNWNITGFGYADESSDGLTFDSSGVFLNDRYKAYPTKSYIDSNPDTKYRATLQFNSDDKDIGFPLNFGIGGSNYHVFDPEKVDQSPYLDDGRTGHTLEMVYSNQIAPLWEFYVDGVLDESFNSSIFSGVTDLYPDISLARDGQLEIVGIKNQVFNKIDYTDSSSWSADYSDTISKTVDSVGSADYNLTHADASLDREIIYAFNDDIYDINGQFEDVSLWTDLEFDTTTYEIGTSTPTSDQGDYVSTVPVFKMNDPIYAGWYLISPSGTWDHTYIEGDYLHQEDPIFPTTQSLWAGRLASDNGVVVNTRDATFTGHDDEIQMDINPNHESDAFTKSAGSNRENYYAYAAYLNYDFYVENNRGLYGGQTSKYDINLEVEYNRGEIRDNIFFENNAPMGPALSYRYYDSSELLDSKFRNMVPFTDALMPDRVIIECDEDMPFHDSNDMYMYVDEINFIVYYSSEPVSPENMLYNQNFDIPGHNSLTEFYVYDRAMNKDTISSTPDYSGQGESLRTLLDFEGENDNINEYIFPSAFSSNTLTFGVSSKAWYPSFGDVGADISADNTINDFRVVPVLADTEGNTVLDPPNSNYPYKTSWWNQQEMALGTPIDIQFDNVDASDLQDVSDVVFKLEFNTTVANFFEDWSWRPGLKIWDDNEGNGKWINYDSIMFAYSDVGDQVVYNNSLHYITGDSSSKYDNMQLLHPETFYFNDMQESTENCSVIFRLSKNDRYNNFDKLFDLQDPNAVLRVLPIIYVIPGKYNSSGLGAWEITYDNETFDPLYRMNISTVLKPKFSYLQTFRETDVIRKNITMAPQFDNNATLAQSWINITAEMTEAEISNIANIVDVFGITSGPVTRQVIQDPTPDTWDRSDFWAFDRTRRAINISKEAALNYDNISFTYQKWYTLENTVDRDYAPPSWTENVTLLENVILNDTITGEITYLTANFENDYSYYGSEPYNFTFNADKSVNFITISDEIDLTNKEVLAVIHYVNNTDTAGRVDRKELIVFDEIKFPFALTSEADASILNISLDLEFFVGIDDAFEGSITNIEDDTSVYSLTLDFYRYYTLDSEPDDTDKIGSIEVEDLTDILYRYNMYSLRDIDLRNKGLDIDELEKCFNSRDYQLWINITAFFNGTHQGKRLVGSFAMEILEAKLDVELTEEKASIGEFQFIPDTTLGSYKYNKTILNSWFDYNLAFLSVKDLYAYNYTSNVGILINQSLPENNYSLTHNLTTMNSSLLEINTSINCDYFRITYSFNDLPTIISNY
ncbi:MAG: hypothetical protein KJI69_06080, partial [Patescibacteria group bacterium]|nr:hypothetical protein [Patescibacteria group bacterium]